ncbi:MAG: hypothetical protein GX589_10420, partial [Deltaproteobacteria bacterium]|nr:hypothetical protein [Deltaproteobacteria bacterium]
ANLGAWSIEEGYFRQPQVQVWQVPIPVIASLGDLALRTPSKFCAGVGTGTADPSISENETQIIIGFIEAVFYDVDIGSAGIPAPTTADFSVHGGLLLTKPDGTPRRLPISFKENIGQNCNMVKGVTHCDVGLISTVGSFRLQDPQNVRLERRDD